MKSFIAPKIYDCGRLAGLKAAALRELRKESGRACDSPLSFRLRTARRRRRWDSRILRRPPRGHPHEIGTLARKSGQPSERVLRHRMSV